MDGIRIDGRRPESKKEVREAIAADPGRVTVEITSAFHARSGQDVALGEADMPVTFVGPDPYARRNFYGTITRGPKGWVVK